MTSRSDTPSLGPLKAALWLYFILLLTEGALRKWILPGLSDLLLIVRDPVALLICLLAFRAQVFPVRLAVIFLGALAFLSVLLAVFNDAPPLVILFGLRTNYLHPLLVFIMAKTLNRDDVIRFGRALMLAAVPIFLLMFLQFEASPSSWLNAGAGGGINGQINGAMGKIRPPGPFSFIDGVVCYFGLVTAFVYYGWVTPGVYRYSFLLLITLVIGLAVPISISRSLLMAVLVTFAFGSIISLRSPKTAFRFVLPLGLIVFGLLSLSQTVYMQAFAMRWNQSLQAGKGTFNDNIVNRLIDTYASPVATFGDVPLLGHGVGMGTLAGARLMNGKVSFALSESELGRIILELGPIVGLAFIGWRLWLALALVFGGWRHSLATNDALPWLLAGSTFLGVFGGQWGSSTQLGFAVFGAGLSLAARNIPPEPVLEDETPVDDLPPEEESAPA